MSKRPQAQTTSLPNKRRNTGHIVDTEKEALDLLLGNATKLVENLQALQASSSERTSGPSQNGLIHSLRSISREVLPSIQFLAGEDAPKSKALEIRESREQQQVRLPYQKLWTNTRLTLLFRIKEMLQLQLRSWIRMHLAPRKHALPFQLLCFCIRLPRQISLHLDISQHCRPSWFQLLNRPPLLTKVGMHIPSVTMSVWSG